MSSAPKVAWAALVGLYDEAILLLRANLAWFALNLPLSLLVALALVPFLGGSADEDGSALVWPFTLAFWLTLLVPTPAGIALGELGRVGAGRNAPRFADFSRALRRHWRTGLKLFVVSSVVLALLAWNVVFYVTVGDGLVRLASILWAYLAAFWLAMQLYLVPLTLHLAKPRLVDLYRRAALLTIGNLWSSLALLFALVLVSLLCTIVPPVYPLLAGAFAALLHAHAFRALRRRYGDLQERDEEETWP